MSNMNGADRVNDENAVCEVVICGSLAFDTLMQFEGEFSDQILPERVSSLSVSFLVPALRREFGGCAGNVAYNLHLLGNKPVVVAALGVDGADYLQRMQAWGLDCAHVRQQLGVHTAQAMIMTDRNNSQITAFHPGAMGMAHEIEVPDAAGGRIGIVAPDGKQAMQLHAAQFVAQGTPFVFDPGQGLPMFDAAELHAFVAQATWIAVNDYEADMLCQRTGKSLAQLSMHVQALIVTRGEHGCEAWQHGVCTKIAPVKALQVVDPTGCGDAFRAGLLHGLARGWTVERCCVLGNRLGATKIAHQGGQNHTFDAVALGA